MKKNVTTLSSVNENNFVLPFASIVHRYLSIMNGIISNIILRFIVMKIQSFTHGKNVMILLSKIRIEHSSIDLIVEASHQSFDLSTTRRSTVLFSFMNKISDTFLELS